VDEHGYVEEEFFVDGEATAFELVPAPSACRRALAVATPRDGDVPHPVPRRAPKGRRSVQRNVVLSWANVTAGFELAGVAARNLQHGDAHVTMSVQKVGLDGYPGAEANALRGWDPKRYGSLSHPAMTSPTTSSPRSPEVSGAIATAAVSTRWRASTSSA